MRIQINTDNNIKGHEALIAQITEAVENALSRFSEHIIHAEVYLSDENSDKKGGHEDIRCMLEARLKGRPAIAVTHQATTLDEAVDGAVDKLANLIENTLGRLHDQELSRTDPRIPEPKFTESL